MVQFDIKTQGIDRVAQRFRGGREAVQEGLRRSLDESRRALSMALKAETGQAATARAFSSSGEMRLGVKASVSPAPDHEGLRKGPSRPARSQPLIMKAAARPGTRANAAAKAVQKSRAAIARIVGQQATNIARRLLKS